MPTSGGAPTSSPSEAGAVFRRLAAAVALFAASWLALLAAYNTLPSVLPGSDQVVAAKRRTMAAASPFAPTTQSRVVIVGDSRILSGFRPDLFDKTLNTTSHNLGLPGIQAIVPTLEAIAHWDPPPTHVLIGNAWLNRAADSWSTTLQDDRALLDRLFPFRRLPKDALVFWARAEKRGGPAASLRYGRTQLDNLGRDRGYHFIVSQSVNAEHRLPDDFSLASDDPDKPTTRSLPTLGPQLDRLLELKQQAGFELIVVPTYVRSRSRADALTEQHPEIEDLGIKVLGPAYWRYPEHLFSDSQHANAAGAERYTQDLATLLAPLLDAP
jgi:hypothetical protein